MVLFITGSAFLVFTTAWISIVSFHRQVVHNPFSILLGSGIAKCFLLAVSICSVTLGDFRRTYFTIYQRICSRFCGVTSVVTTFTLIHWWFQQRLVHSEGMMMTIELHSTIILFSIWHWFEIFGIVLGDLRDDYRSTNKICQMFYLKWIVSSLKINGAFLSIKASL